MKKIWTLTVVLYGGFRLWFYFCVRGKTKKEKYGGANMSNKQVKIWTYYSVYRTPVYEEDFDTNNRFFDGFCCCFFMFILH